MTVHQFFCILHFCHTCSLCRVELVVQFPTRGSTQVLLCIFPDVLWLWHFLYSVGLHSVSSLHIYTFVVSRAFIAGAASQAGDADSSRASGLTSWFQGSMNVHRGALLLKPTDSASVLLYLTLHTLVAVAVHYKDKNAWKKVATRDFSTKLVFNPVIDDIFIFRSYFRTFRYIDLGCWASTYEEISLVKLTKLDLSRTLKTVQ